MPKATKWLDLPNQRDDVERRYREGGTLRQIAREYACRTDLISDVLRARGYTISRGREKITPERRDALIARFREGATIRALAREFEMSEGGVSALLGRAGVKTAKGTRWDSERLQQLREFHAMGLTLAQIGRELGLTYSAVGPRMRQAGIPPQPARSRENHPGWRGGRSLVAGGEYVQVRPNEDDLPYCVPNTSGYVLEHRLIMGRMLGRPLLASETVHHINGNGLDNAPTNLQLRQGQHGNGVLMVCNDCGSHDITAQALG